MLVQVQEVGQFGTTDKLETWFVTGDSIHIYHENCGCTAECKKWTLSVVQDISHKWRLLCLLLLVFCSMYQMRNNLVSCSPRQHMLVYGHFSNGLSDRPCCNKQPNDTENMLEPCVLILRRIHNNRMSWHLWCPSYYFSGGSSSIFYLFSTSLNSWAFIIHKINQLMNYCTSTSITINSALCRNGLFQKCLLQKSNLQIIQLKLIHWAIRTHIMTSLLPIAEVYDWLRKTVPARMWTVFVCPQFIFLPLLLLLYKKEVRNHSHSYTYALMCI
jgi:hypothetical protein